MTHGNASIAESDYDTGGRLTAVRNLKSDRSVISIFTYSYDNGGNRTAVAEASGDLVTWSCDNTYQLTREQRSGANAYDVTFTYDGVGNRLTKLEGGTITSYSYDAANQLNYEYTPSQRTTYSYDANGNTALVNAGGSLTTNAWDIENHLTIVQLPAGGRTTATYDGDGKRRSYNDSGGVKNIVWDGDNILIEADSGGSTVARYTMAPEVYGELLAQRRGANSSFYHCDALGSARILTNAAQTATDTADYRAFGALNASTGSTANPFGWLGRIGYYRQPDTSDYWVRARVYRPQTARWVSRDASEEGVDWYSYAHGNPTVNSDPSGFWTLPGKTVSCDYHKSGFFCQGHADNPTCPKFARGWTGAWPHVHYKWDIAGKPCCKYEDEREISCHKVEQVDCGDKITATKTVGKKVCSVTVSIIDAGPGASGAVLDLHPGPAGYLMECVTGKKWDPQKSDHANCIIFGHIKGVTISG